MLNIKDNIPNTLTLLRIIMLPMFIILLVYNHVHLALLTFFFASLTDILDGYFARILNQKTELGSYLDPIADKILINSSLIVFSTMDINSASGIIPLWYTIIVISRDIIIIFGYFVVFFIAGKVKVVPSREGKATSFLNVFVIGLVLVFLSLGLSQPYFDKIKYLLYFVSVITVISGLKYILQGINLINAGQDHISD